MSMCPNCGDEWPEEWPRCFSCGFDGPRPGGGRSRGEADIRTKADRELELDLSHAHARAPAGDARQRTQSYVDSPVARQAAERARQAVLPPRRASGRGGRLKSIVALLMLLAFVGGTVAYWPQISGWWGKTFGGEAGKKKSLGADWGGFACDPGGTRDKMFCHGWVRNNGKTPIELFQVDVTFGKASQGDRRVKETIEVGPIPPGKKVAFRDGWIVPKDQASKFAFSNIRIER